MIPYLIFSLIALIITQVKNIALGRESLDLLQAVSGVFIWMDMSSLSNTYAFVLWFLPALFFSRSVLFLIRKYINNMFIQFLVVFFLFSLSFYIDVPFGFDNALNALLFVFIGNVAFSSFQNNGWLFVSLPSVVLIYMYIEMPLLDMASKNYSNIIINILLSVSTVHLLILLLKSIDLNFDLIRFWAKNTMLLFIAHVYTNNAAHIVVEYLNYGGWPLKLLISIVLLHMLLLVKLIFNNKLIFKYV